MNIFKVLSEQEVQRIHSAALEVLKTIGLKIHSEKVRGMLEEAGAIVNHETTLVHFPPNLVEESVKKAPRRVIYGARNPKYDLVLEPGGNTYCRPITGAEGYIDLETGKYREAKMSDVKDWAILVDALDNISYCTAPYPGDIWHLAINADFGYPHLYSGVSAHLSGIQKATKNRKVGRFTRYRLI